MADAFARLPRSFGATSVALGLALASVPARAEPAPETTAEVEQDPRTRAKAKLLRGTELYEQGKYEEALVEFQDASSLYASPDFQYNIGLCHERLGDYEAAVRAFETYLRNKPDASDAAAVRDRVRDLKERIELRKAQKDPPPETDPPEKDPPPEGKDPPPEDTVPPPDDTTDEPDPNAGRGLLIGGGVMLGLGVTGAAAGGVALGVLAGRPAGEVDDVLNGGNPQERTLAETRDLADDADRLRTGQVIALAGGGLLATGGLVMMLVGLKQRREGKLARIQVMPTMAGAVLRGRF